MDGLQFGEYCAYENLCLDSKYHPLGVVGYPNCGATEFFVRLQFQMVADALQSQIKFDRIESASTPRNFFSPDYGDSGKIGICRGVNRQAICTALC